MLVYQRVTCNHPHKLDMEYHGILWSKNSLSGTVPLMQHQAVEDTGPVHFVYSSLFSGSRVDTSGQLK